MSGEETVMVYITCRDEDEAVKISKALLEKKLVACANMFPIRSLYRWEGVMEDETETAVLFKTRSALAEKVTIEVNALHSYDVPCVEVVKVGGGNPEFLSWVREETEGE